MSKTICFKSGNVSAYVYDNDVPLAVESNRIVVGATDSPTLIIGDMNTENATVYEGVTAPSGWKGGKHTYNGSAWGDVSGWVDPAAASLESEKARYAADSAYSSTFTTAIQTEIDRIKALQCSGGGGL